LKVVRVSRPSVVKVFQLPRGNIGVAEITSAPKFEPKKKKPM